MVTFYLACLARQLGVRLFQAQALCASSAAWQGNQCNAGGEKKKCASWALFRNKGTFDYTQYCSYACAGSHLLVRAGWSRGACTMPGCARECASDGCTAVVFGRAEHCAECVADDEAVKANVKEFSRVLEDEARVKRWVLRWLSITVSKLPSGDLDDALARNLFEQWVVPCCVQGMIGIEVGPRQGNKHFQIWVLCYGPADINHHKRQVNAAIRSACCINSAGLKVTTEKFGVRQEPGKMSGYCTKDIGQVHFKCYVHGLSRNMIKSGIEEWQHISSTTLTGNVASSAHDETRCKR